MTEKLEIIKDGHGRYSVRNERGWYLSMSGFDNLWWEYPDGKNQFCMTRFLWKARRRRDAYLNRKKIEIVE